MVKPELTLQHLDEWMVRWKKYQSYSDYSIERAAQTRRQRNYAITAGVFGMASLWTAAPATIDRIFGAPHFFDNGIDSSIKDSLRGFVNGRRRWTPNGYGRIAAIGIPTYATICVLEHFGEKARLDQYLKQETVFGEQARRLVKDGKIEEFLAPNIKAPLAQEEAGVYVA